MFKTSGAEATLIVTETSRHAPLAELAMSYGLVSQPKYEITIISDAGQSTYCLRNRSLSMLRLLGG